MQEKKLPKNSTMGTSINMVKITVQDRELFKQLGEDLVTSLNESVKQEHSD